MSDTLNASGADILENLLTNKLLNANPVQSDWPVRVFYCSETVLLKQKDLLILTRFLPVPYSTGFLLVPYTCDGSRTRKPAID